MYIFLDIDGVLNQLQSWFIDKKCVEVLSKICMRYDAKVVLISSWRLGYCRNIKYCSPQVINLASVLNDFNIHIFGRTSDLSDRGSEIEDYINKYDVSRYMILDDDPSLYTDTENLYVVNPKTGLVDSDVKNIIRRFG